MAMAQQLKEYLESESVKFESSEHAAVFTAQEVAGTEHVPGKQMVKSVIVKADGDFIMCVLPAIHLIDFEKLKNLIKCEDLSLASEEEIGKLFPDYDVGAEPPFGHLYGIPVYCDKILEEDEDICFNAGTHTDVVKLRFQDYKKLEKPIIEDIGTHI